MSAYTEMSISQNREGEEEESKGKFKREKQYIRSEEEPTSRRSEGVLGKTEGREGQGGDAAFVREQVDSEIKTIKTTAQKAAHRSA